MLIEKLRKLKMSLEFNHGDAKLADRFVVSDLRQCALLLDIDGTILDLAPAQIGRAHV